MATAAPTPSQMTQRLVQQLERRAKLEAELLQQQRKLAQHAAEQQTLATKNNLVTVERERLQALRTTLSKQHEAVIAMMRAREATDQAKRTKLSEELTARIKEVNETVERENLDWTTALTENQRLKDKINVIKDSLTAGGAKFAELMDTRQKETEGMAERGTLISGANDELRARTERAKVIVSERRSERDRLKSESDKFVARFSEIQVQVNAANAHFDKSKEEYAKLSKRIKQLEAEREITAKACERADAERSVEIAKEQKLEAEAKLLVAQTQKLLDIMAVLAGRNPASAPGEPQPSPAASAPAAAA